MAEIVPMQSLYCSMQDENKICSFDIEVLTGPTTPDPSHVPFLANQQRKRDTYA